MHDEMMKIMEEYFQSSEGTVPSQLREIALKNTSNIPIQPSVVSWRVVPTPNRLSRKFEFDEFSQLWMFLESLLEYQEEIGHHALLSVGPRYVNVEVYTHEVEDVTEIDKDYARMADEIYEDVREIGGNEEDEGWS